MPIPSITGTAKRNIIVVPCTVKIWLYRPGRKESIVGLRELQPHQQRFDAANQQKDERGDDVAQADFLMVDCRQPAQEARLGAPRLPKHVEMSA